MDVDIGFRGVKALYGEESFKKFQQAKILIIGLGGVGSWIAESLVRSGFIHLSLVDLDEICISNTNRQIHTTSKTLGKSKVLTMKSRLEEINPLVKIKAIEDFYTNETSEAILEETSYSWVIDAIDTLQYKAYLVDQCLKKEIPLIMAGSAGGKKDPSQLRVADINLSYHDPLLQRLRKKLRRDYQYPRDKKPYGVPCIFTPEESKQAYCTDYQTARLDCSGSLGSSCIFTASMGLRISHYIMEHL